MPANGRSVRFFATLLLLISAAGCGRDSLTSGVDRVAPTPGGGGLIVVSDLTGSGATVQWVSASDSSSAAGLAYKVVVSASPIATIDEAEKATTKQDWQVGATSAAVSGLDDGKTYYLAVIVKDGAGNKALYKPQTFTTKDESGPVPGAGGLLTISGVKKDEATITWAGAFDNGGAAQTLTYTVVASKSPNLTTVADAEQNAASKFDQGGKTEITLASLDGDTVYYVQVIVSDEAGNRSVYQMGELSTGDGTAPVPGNGGQLAAAEADNGKVTLSWSMATDNTSAQHTLQYRVVWSATLNLTTVDDASVNGTVVTDWTANLSSVQVTIPAQSTRHYTVLVKDAGDNTAIYRSASVSTVDNAAPVAGNDGKLLVTEIGAESLSLSWTAATDNKTSAEKLSYKVVTAAQNVTTVEDATLYGAVALNWTLNTTTFMVPT